MAWVEWLKVEGNQKFLGWLGGAVVAVAGALWAAYGAVSGQGGDAPKPSAAPVVAVGPASATAPAVQTAVSAPAVAQTVTASGSGVAAAVAGSGNVVQIGK